MRVPFILAASAFSLLAVPVAADESKTHKEAVSYPAMVASKSHKEAFAQPLAELPPESGPALAALTAPAVRTVDQPITPTGGNAPPAAAEVGPRISGKLGDDQILEVAHIANEREIEQARLAQSRATDPRVRALADDIIAQHSEADRKQTAVQQLRSITPSVSPVSQRLLIEGQDQLDVLSEKNGAAFDRAYLDAQVKGQREVLDVIDRQLVPSANDADVKRLVNDMRPGVRNNLRAAKALQQKIKE